MLFTKSFRLALSNWKVLLKSIFCQLVALTLFLAVGVFALGDVMQAIIDSFRSNGVGDFLSHVMVSLFDGSFNTEHFLQDLQTLTDQIVQSVSSVTNIWNRIEISVIICALAFIVYRVLISFTDIAVGYQLNEFMDSNAIRPFSWFLFKKAGKSFKFLFLQLLLALLADILIIAGCIAIAIVCTILFGWWAIIPVVIFGVALYALRLSFMAYCLPSVVYQDEKHTRVAFADGLSHVIHSFGKVFWRTLIIVVVMTVTSAVAYFFNENRWIAVGVSAVVNFLLFFILKCINFVLYYESNNYPYFYKSVYLEGTEKYNRKNKSK